MKEGAISPYIVLAPAEDDADGEEPQMSIANTGWSEEEMERMRAMGYDGMDILRAWYSCARHFLFQWAAYLDELRERAKGKFQ